MWENKCMYQFKSIKTRKRQAKKRDSHKEDKGNKWKNEVNQKDNTYENHKEITDISIHRR